MEEWDDVDGIKLHYGQLSTCRSIIGACAVNPKVTKGQAGSRCHCSLVRERLVLRWVAVGIGKGT